MATVITMEKVVTLVLSFMIVFPVGANSFARFVLTGKSNFNVGANSFAHNSNKRANEFAPT
jgi:hypothetical protein